MPELYKIQPTLPENMERFHITTLPILLLNVHSSCNCRCVMCDIWKRRDSVALHAMDLERHRESIQQLGVKHVVMTGGEPLLNQELDGICLFFREMDIRTTLLTTGLLLFKKADRVVKNFDEIIISIDGPSSVHDQVRRIRDAFSTIRKGVAAVRALQPMMPILSRMTVQRSNHTHLRSAVAAVKSIGLNGISFLPADVTSKAFNRDEPWPESRQDEVSLTRDELHALEDEIELLIETYQEEIREGFIAENDTKLRRIADRFRERLDGTPPRSPLCNAPWVSAVMEVDGNVRPCFFHDSVGSTKIATLYEVINGDPALRFRGSLDVATNPVCQRCVCSLNYRG
jgi:Fe-coproporphyrin III synthase